MLSRFQAEINGISVGIAVYLGVVVSWMWGLLVRHVALGTEYHLSTDYKKRLLYQTGWGKLRNETEINHEEKRRMFFISLEIEKWPQLKSCLAVSHLPWRWMPKGGSWAFEENSQNRQACDSVQVPTFHELGHTPGTPPSQVCAAEGMQAGSGHAQPLLGAPEVSVFSPYPNWKS